MSDQDAFERILVSLHDAMLDPTQWPTTSALIDEACGLQGNALLVGEGPQDNIRIFSAGLYYRGQHRADLEREYLEVYHPIDERVPRIRELPDSRLTHVTDLYTEQELKTSLTYNELLPRAHAQDGLNVRLDGPGGSHLTWALHDPVTPGGWEPSQVALLNGLLPHIRQFVRVRQALAEAGALGTSVPDLLAHSRVGVIHLDQRGQILATNDRARTLLRHGDGVSDRAGGLQARLPADRVRLAQLVAEALPSSNAAAVSGSMLLHRSSIVPPFVVHVKPVSPRQGDFGARRVAALVLLIEPGRQAYLDPTLVATILGLTPPEGQVAVWLAEGQSVRDIAEATGRTEGAVYWHLRQIYQKLSISRQGDLVRLVLSLTEFA